MNAEGFRLELDGVAGQPPRFAPGSRLAGRVVVRPETDTTVRGLTVVVRWTTGGKGNVEEGEWWTRTWTLVGPEQVVTAGMSLVQPFELTLPPEPWTYAGKIVSINWEVRATLDVPWAIDPAVSTPFTLHP